MDYEKQIDIIGESANKIQLNKVTILTGKNGSGKSLLRKLLARSIAEKTGKKDLSHLVASISMESRSQCKHDFGAFQSLGIDDPENPTGAESIHNINMIFKTVKEDSPRYIVIDEPEIGMGEELVAGLVGKLNSMFDPFPKQALGIMVVTHNRYLVKNLENAEFVNLEGLTKEEWLNRIIIPTNIKQFEDDALGLYRAINARIEKNKSKK